MWIRVSPAEATSSRRVEVLRTAFLYTLAGWGLWYLLVRLFTVFGALPRESVSGWVGCGVMALVLPAAWRDSRRSLRRSKNTMVCDRCNIVKSFDGEPACQCGGQYFALSEMKWVDPAKEAGPLPEAKAGTESLARDAG